MGSQDKFQYYSSFLFENVVETRSSSLNPVLIIKYYKGKYLLDTENANYSFGKLHAVFVKAFRKLKINKRNIGNALILGYGGGSIASILNENFQTQKVTITGVEADLVIIGLAEKYFRLKEFNNVNVVCEDAEEFVNSCSNMFDLIAVDLFIDSLVPGKFCTCKFYSSLKKLLSPGGLIVFNRMIYGAPDDPDIAIKEFKDVFPNAQIINVVDNLVLVYEDTGV